MKEKRILMYIYNKYSYLYSDMSYAYFNLDCNCIVESNYHKETTFTIYQYTYLLCIYWYNPDEFDWACSDLLNDFCPKFKEIWEEDYLLRKII